MDYKFIAYLIVGLVVFINIVSLIKILITKYFELKISMSKRSEIKIHDGSRMKSVSFDSYNHNPEDVVRLFKNSDRIEEGNRKSS